MPLAWFILAHSAAAAPVPVPPRGAATYDVVVVAGIGEQRIEEQRVVTTERARKRTWTVTTTRTEGRLEDAAGVVRFDSDARMATDPWPLVTTHAVASVPLTVRFSKSGTPEVAVDEDAWAAAARSALSSLDLPEAAQRSGASLVDAQRRVAEVARLFVGTPSTTLTRADQIAGNAVLRDETCEMSRAQDQVEWRCRGQASAPDGQASPVQELQTWTTLTVDRSGLLSMEEGWSGTLVHVAPDGRTVTDSPIGGRRLIQRR